MMKPQAEADLSGYLADARSWADDRQAGSSRMQRAAWIVAGAATTVAVLEAIALAGLAPLETVVPIAVLVDRQTGHVTTLDASQPVRLTTDSALAKSMLAQYVMARETVERGSIATDYRKVVLWSGETARASYLDLMKPGNPGNPLSWLPRQTSIQARVKSVSLLDDGQAMVRFDRVRRSDMGGEISSAPYLSVLRYRFRDRPLAEADRFINPLGFEVVRYRRDQESAGEDAAAPPVSPQAPIPSPAAPAGQAADGSRP